MKKVTAFIGSQTKRHTYQAVQEFEKNLKQYGEIDFEYVTLSDYRLEFCRGCLQCFDKGEEYCTLRDDRDVLLGKMEQSDGVILATPNYAWHVSARMKNFLDRTAFINHRPRFFNKAFTAIVTQGIGRGDDILKFLYFTGESLGFHVSKGCCVTTREPMNEVQKKEYSRKIKQAADRFYEELLRPAPPPSLFRLMIFRMSLPLVKSAGEEYRDYHYYKEKGWFEAEYYYPTSLGFPKKVAGRLFDFVGRQMVNRQ